MNSINKWFNNQIAYPYLKRIRFNFGVVDESGFPILMRSSWPSGNFIKYLRENYGLEVLLSLEDSIDSDIEYAKNDGLIHVTKFNNWRAKNGIDLATANEVITYMKKDLQSGYGTLVHCKAGADRTGLFCALYRIYIQGWSIEKAKNEMFFYGHIPLIYPNIWKSIDNITKVIKI